MNKYMNKSIKLNPFLSFNTKKGFTLAEVLITLVIVGIIAAVTIPTIIAEHRKQVLIEQLKVAVSVFAQGFKQAMVDDGVSDLRDTRFYKACDAQSTEHFEWNDNCRPYLKKYFNVIKIESVDDMKALGDTVNIITDTAKCKELVGVTNKWYYLNDKSKCRGWKNLAITLANGIRADLYLSSTGSWSAGSMTALDVNGSKPPNTWGRDTFSFYIGLNGNMIPSYGREHFQRLSEANGNSFEDYIQNYHWSRNDVCSSTTTEEGYRCASRVIESGWKMDY